MNKNLIQRLKEIVKKEGFYIALFLCLCVIVTVGTFSYKKFISQNTVTNLDESNVEDSNEEDSDKDVSYNTGDKSNVSKNEMPNAERAENKASVSENKNTAENDQKTATVSNNNNVKFVKPLDGTESRNYTYPKPVQIGENTFRTIKGVNLQAKIGTDVKAAAEGVVDLVENSGVEEGMVVEIKHANGLKTRYGNLAPEVSVKNGEKVKANQVIGKVGETAKVFTKDIFGEFLNLQVIDANNEQVNPEKYFNFNSK